MGGCFSETKHTPCHSFQSCLPLPLPCRLADIRISSHPERKHNARTEQGGIAAASANVVRAIGQAILPAIGLDRCQRPVLSLVEGSAASVREKRAADINAIVYGLISFALALNAKGADHRVPKSVDAGKIAKGTRVFLHEHLQKADWFLPDRASPRHKPEAIDAATRKAIGQNAEWVTDKDEGGLVLYRGPFAVQKKDGSLVRLSWRDLEKLSSEELPADNREPMTGIIYEGGW